MDVFSTRFVLFEILAYKVSLVELTGTIAGLFSVWYAARNNILTWPTGILNVACFFFIFRETGLFADMFLQVYYFVICIYGWYYWKKSAQETFGNISIMRPPNRVFWFFFTFSVSAGLGFFMSRIHLLFPDVFLQPAAYPYADTFVAVASVIANTLMARKKIENWVMWILIDALACFIYYQKGILLISAEFFIFTLLAVFGLINWLKLMKNDRQKAV